jgi:hypothetical protein
MSNLKKVGNQTGYDASAGLQIVPLNGQTVFYLVAGEGLDVSVDDPSIATVTADTGDNKSIHSSSQLSAWEKEQVIRKLVIKGKAAGSTRLHAKQGSSDWVSPLTIRVVRNQESRQVGKGMGEVTPELQIELSKLSLRDAVIRIAEDQMHSAIATQSDGFGVYNVPKEYNWCGAFAFWCWQQAAAIKKVDCPFGKNNDVLLSPQKAIHWAMQSSTPGLLLRYAGPDPMAHSKDQQAFIDITGANGRALHTADIVLVRSGSAQGWKHVSMVRQVNGVVSIQSIDGNQGKFQSIKTVNRDLTSKLPDGSYSLVFVHVLV